MIPTYNLIDEAWIPVLDLQGRPQEVGLRRVLRDAHQLRRVAAPTGMETAAILRLLLTILHRTHDTSSRQAWGDLWRRGQFDAAALDAYFAAWNTRFDLFHPQRPFYQLPTDRKKPVSTAGFFPGLAAAGHFNHAVQFGERDLSPAEAARGLLVAQTFGLSGGCLPSERLSHKASPWVAGLVFFVEADTLFATLTCNLLRYDDVSPREDLAQTAEDRPNWELNDPYHPRAQALGYLDYLTWPSRAVWLNPEVQDGKIIVRRYVDFVGLPPPAKTLDPFKYYRKDERTTNPSGHVALYLNPNKAAWRSSAAILRLHRTGLRPPQTLNWLSELRRFGAIQSPQTRLVGYGMVVETQTKVVLMRREAFPLPLAYLDQSADPEHQADLVSTLDIAIQQAEQVASALQAATLTMAKAVCPTVGEGDPGQIKRVARSLSSARAYWAALEQPFFRLVLDLPEAPQPQPVQARWLAEVLVAGRRALAASQERAGQYSKALKAGVLARSMFEDKLRKASLTQTQPKGESSE